MGRQFSQQQMERILGYIDLSTLKGARIITVGTAGCCESGP
ncbi:hypothetical protein OCZ71_00655 [Proteus mirabilis]|nr:hypothetical protein [Proteus mirabilis]MCU9585678.1 hypothetical protein [Proteus mirabilis]